MKLNDRHWHSDNTVIWSQPDSETVQRFFCLFPTKSLMFSNCCNITLTIIWILTQSCNHTLMSITQRKPQQHNAVVWCYKNLDLHNRPKQHQCVIVDVTCELQTTLNRQDPICEQSEKSWDVYFKANKKATLLQRGYWDVGLIRKLFPVHEEVNLHELCCRSL